MEINFKPFHLLDPRIESAKNDSDLALFYDLLLYGEYLTKLITLAMVSNINEDGNRTKYRHEYNLIRGNAIGEFARTLDEICAGPSADILISNIRDFELKELTQRASGQDWQYQTQKYLIKCLEIFEISHNSLQLKSPLRSWFNYFVLLRNKTKGHGATRTEPCALANPLLEKSIKIIIENFSSFKRPWVHLHQNYSGKYNVSYLNERTSDFDFLQKESQHHLPNGVYIFLGKPRKVNLMYTNVELTDFFLPNGNFTGDSAESISYITDERSKISATDYLIPATDLPQSLTEGKNQLDIKGNCFTNLPTAPDEYVERTRLEEELIKVLKDTERFPIVTLIGRGGIGKTSLALNIVEKILSSEVYDLILWFSARDIDLLVDGPKPVQTKFLKISDVAEEYCNLVVPELKVKNKEEYFSKQLTKNDLGRTLYIFDNFETVTNPIEVYEWLNTFIRNPNKILITSRLSRNFKADYPIEVKGMDEDECKSLINLVSENLKIKQLLTSFYIKDLISESDGHPYIIKILLGEVAKAGKILKIERIVADQEKILNALFKRTFHTFSAAAKRIFLTLCSWHSAVPSLAIEATLWRPGNAKFNVTSAIEELRKSSFIEVIHEGTDEIINVPLAAYIYGKTELEVYPEKLLILEDRKLLMEFGVTSNSNINSGVLIKVERKFKNVAKRVNSLEDFKTEIPILEYIANKVPMAFLYIADIFEEYKDYESAKHFIREFIKSEISIKEKVRAWKRLSDICKITKDWDGESHALSELIVIPNIDFNLISDASNRINQYFGSNPESRTIEYKNALLTKVIDVMSKRIVEGNATDYSRLSWLLLSNNQEDRARNYIQQGLELDPYNSHCLNLQEKFS